MFTYKEISSLNQLELIVYNYIIKNTDKVMYMTIRELADAAGVSTTTVLRFCKKMNCDGYSEFRVRFKLYLEHDVKPPVSFGISEIISYFKSINNSEFDELLDAAAAQIAATRRIIFVGIGTSGALVNTVLAFSLTLGNIALILTILIILSIVICIRMLWRLFFRFLARQKKLSVLLISLVCKTARLLASPIVIIRPWLKWLILIYPIICHLLY